MDDDITKRSWVQCQATVDGRIEVRDRLGRVWDYQLEEKIRQRIQETTFLAIIKLSDQPEYQDQSNALEGIFEWLLRDGTLRQYQKDWFYSPKDGVLGPRTPSQTEILRALMSTNGQRTGYITGPVLYNRMGLTTQVPGVVTIATMQPIEEERLHLGGIRVRLVPARFDFQEKDIPALEILDALTALAEGPGLGSPDAFSDPMDPFTKHMRRLIDKQPARTRERLITLVEKYPAATKKAFSEIQIHS